MKLWLRWIVAVSLVLMGQGAIAADIVTLSRAEAAIARPDGQPGPWRAVALPHDWEDGFPGHSGAVWYRLHFETPADAGLLGLYIRRACTNLEVYLNGELIGSGGLMTGPVARNCYYPQLFTPPRSLLKPQGNELLVRVVGFSAREVSARQRAAGLSDVVLGPRDALVPMHETQLFWNITMAQIIAATITVLGLSMLALAALRRKDTYLLYFGLFSLGWALLSARLFVRNVPLSHMATEILICTAFAPVLACAFLFLMRLVHRRHRWVDAVLWAQVPLVPLVLAAAAPSNLLAAASAVYNLLALEFLASVVYFFVAAWKAHRRQFWLMGAVLLLAVVLVAVEIALQNDLLPLPKIHVIHFAMPLVFLVIGARLVNLFVLALNRAETVNQELEARVTEKSREIERSYEQLTTLRAEQAAHGERQRIASDLHDDLGAKLLTIAQASESDRVASLARQALDEMRLSVRGLTGQAALAGDVLADWRAETVSRLSAAGFQAEWDAADPPLGLVLPARTHVQLTRVLREATSNAIRHSGGNCCRVRISFAGGGLTLEVEDNGRGWPPEARPSQRGHGLPNIERRARNLQGTHGLLPAEGGGALLRVCVPLATAESATIG
ncbi:ATP-binding protein [Ramlibacter sp. WS9]|uniref:sensor histidine kinase n=1 Tax=Ramlibacter sp. WS9 TaxID=1882741 RepID=UPI0013050CDF|nr:ATP-binding protein [Ramlibacter sp. WS9]